MPVLALRALLAALLLGAALLKLASPRASSAALATFGIRSARVRWAAWGALVAVEAGLAGAVLAGSAAGAYAAAAIQLAFAAALGGALAKGRAGAPCGCFGARSRVSAGGVGRNLALGTALSALPLLPSPHATTDEWLALGLAVALIAVAGLVVAVLALAREVGELRVSLGHQAALDIAGEGPEIGGRTDLIGRFSPGEAARLALAIFSSEGCAVCASLRPALSLLERDPLVAVRSFDEYRDADAWSALSVPGAPYAVALGRDGTVLAKGTFNNLPQLESVLGTAERRVAEAVRA